MKKLQEDINAKMFMALKVSEVSKVPFLFISAPGMGKSTSVEMFAQHCGYELVMLRGNSTSESEVMGYDVVDAANPTSKSTKHLRPSWFEMVMQNSANGKRTLLFIDELTTASSFVQSALLHLIFERRVGMENIPEDTLIVSAGNYSQSLGNNFELIPPLMNRFCIFNIVPTVSDLNIFLNEFDGSLLTGSPKNKMNEIKKTLESLDSMAMEIEPTDRNKIGEYIEAGLKEQTKVLATTGKKVLNLAVTDMASLYQDTNDDSLLKGFVTFRTLNYLKKVTLAMYECFGSKGLTSATYRLMVQGLCGIGLSRDSSKNVVVTDVDREYFDQIGLVLGEIEKLKNTSLLEYGEFFAQALGEAAFPDGTKFPGEKSIYDNAQINVITNKLDELLKDPSVAGFARPIRPEHIEKLGEILQYNSRDNVKNTKFSGSVSTTGPTLEEITSKVVRWNFINDCLANLRVVVDQTSCEYSQATKNSLKKIRTDISRNYYKVQAYISMFSRKNPDQVGLIPASKDTSIDDIRLGDEF